MVHCHELQPTLRLGEIRSILQLLLGTKIYRLNAGIISDAYSHPRWHAVEPSRIPLDPVDRNRFRERPCTCASQHVATRVHDWSRIRERRRYSSSICGIYEDLGRVKEPVCGMKVLTVVVSYRHVELVLSIWNISCLDCSSL